MTLTDADNDFIMLVINTLKSQRARNKEEHGPAFRELRLTMSKSEIALRTGRKTLRETVVAAITDAFGKFSDFATTRGANGEIIITTLDPTRVKTITHFDSYNELIKYANSL